MSLETRLPRRPTPHDGGDGSGGASGGGGQGGSDASPSVPAPLADGARLRGSQLQARNGRAESDAARSTVDATDDPARVDAASFASPSSSAAAAESRGTAKSVLEEPSLPYWLL